MSDDLFPKLPGLKWGTVKAPIFSTAVLTAASGRSTRGSFQSYPQWKITASYEFLRGGNGYDELQQVVGFFCARLGQWDSFLYRDDDDYQVTNQALGIGDGVTKEFRFVRSFGGFVEPVLAPDAMWLYLDRGAALGKWRVSHQSRTNSFGRTEDYGNSAWTKEGLTVTANAVNDPAGVATAELLTEDSSTGGHDIYRSLAPPGGAGEKHVISFYVKSNGRTICYLKSFWDGCGGAEFDLAGDAVNFTDAGVIAAGLRPLTNGWHRIWIVVRPTTADAHSARLYLKAAAGGSVSYTGNGTGGMYVDWAQCEPIDEDAPDEPTEYISSTGAGATTAAAAFALTDHGYFEFVDAPPSGVLISWSGTFNYRVYFTHDTTEFAQFMKDLYEVRKVEFLTDK